MSRFLPSTNNSSSAIHGAIPGHVQYPYLKRDVIVANANLELLLSNDVLFWPVRVIFPLCAWRRSGYAVNSFRCVTYFVISLASTILLSSFTISGPTHTRGGWE